MIYEHIRTGVHYLKLADSFSVERQAHSVVYASLANGQVFDRGLEKFTENFRLVRDAQAGIEPKAPHA